MCGLHLSIEHVLHSYKNFKKTWAGDHMESLVWDATRAYRKETFEQQMSKIRAKSQAAYAWLMSVERKDKF